jgi:hypothetical protein
MNKVDDNTIKEFIEYYDGTSIPNPEQYPKQFEFMIKSFLHSKNMKEMKVNFPVTKN